MGPPAPEAISPIAFTWSSGPLIDNQPDLDIAVAHRTWRVHQDDKGNPVERDRTLLFPVDAHGDRSLAVASLPGHRLDWFPSPVRD
jgi:hypothetical protein